MINLSSQVNLAQTHLKGADCRGCRIAEEVLSIEANRLREALFNYHTLFAHLIVALNDKDPQKLKESVNHLLHASEAVGKILGLE